MGMMVVKGFTNAGTTGRAAASTGGVGGIVRTMGGMTVGTMGVADGTLPAALMH
jgi:hypothetical protein